MQLSQMKMKLCHLYQTDLGHMQMSFFYFGTIISAVTKNQVFAMFIKDVKGRYQAYCIFVDFRMLVYELLTERSSQIQSSNFKTNTGHSCTLFEHL